MGQNIEHWSENDADQECMMSSSSLWWRRKSVYLNGQKFWNTEYPLCITKRSHKISTGFVMSQLHLSACKWLAEIELYRGKLPTCMEWFSTFMVRRTLLYVVTKSDSLSGWDQQRRWRWGETMG